MNVELFQCSKCHNTMEECDFAFNADEDFQSEAFDFDLLEYLLKNYSLLCHKCLKQIKNKMLDYPLNTW